MPYRMRKIDWSYLVNPTMAGIQHKGRMDALRYQNQTNTLGKIAGSVDRRRQEGIQQSQFDARQSQQQGQFDQRMDLMGREEDRRTRALDFDMAQKGEDERERQAQQTVLNEKVAMYMRGAGTT